MEVCLGSLSGSACVMPPSGTQSTASSGPQAAVRLQLPGISIVRSCGLTAADVSFFIFRALAKKTAIAKAEPSARPKATKVRKPAKAKPVQPDEPIWLSGQPSQDEAAPSDLQGFTFSLESALMIGNDCGPVMRRNERPAVRKAESAGDCVSGAADFATG